MPNHETRHHPPAVRRDYWKNFRRIRPLSRRLLPVLALFILTGCPQRQLPPPSIPGAALVEMTTEEVSQRITQRLNAFQSLRGTGKVRIQTWDERYKFSEAFVLEKPGRFRLETLGFLDQPMIFLTSDEQSLSLYSKKQNILYRGVASQDNLFKLSGINLSVEDMILVLSGNPPQLSSMNSEWGLPLPGSQQYYLERVSLNSNKVQRIWYDTRLQTIVYLQEDLLTSGDVILKVSFDDYRAEAGAYPLPARILIDRPLDRTRVEITYKFYDINQPIDQALFSFLPPSNAKIAFLDDQSIEQLERLAPYEEFRVEQSEQK